MGFGVAGACVRAGCGGRGAGESGLHAVGALGPFALSAGVRLVGLPGPQLSQPGGLRLEFVEQTADPICGVSENRDRPVSYTHLRAHET